MKSEKEVGIDWNEIDVDCREMVSYFNSKGLTTEFSCSGHEERRFYIQFLSSVDDGEMCRFLNQYENKYGNSPFHGKFTKWYRKINKVMVSCWRYEVDTVSRANLDLKRMKGNKYRVDIND